MFLRYLFLIHAVLILAAAVVLVLAPGLIPETVGIAFSQRRTCFRTSWPLLSWV